MSKILLEGGAGALLQEDGSSFILLEEIRHDADSETTGTANPTTHTHTPNDTPAGVVVTIVHSQSALDIVTGVTYGGVAMTRIATAQTPNDDGQSYLYFLGSGIPTGAQTVSVARSEATTLIHVVCSTISGDGDTEVIDFDTEVGNAAAPDPQDNLAYAGRSALTYGATYHGSTTAQPLTEFAGMVRIHDHGLISGNDQSVHSRSFNPQTDDFTFGYTANTKEQFAMVTAAIALVAASDPTSVSAAITTGGLNTSGAGKTGAIGSGAVTVGGLVTVGAGKTGAIGSGAVTVGGLVTSGTGSQVFSGTGAITPAGLNTSGQGKAGALGSGAITIGGVASSGAGSITFSGSGTVTTAGLGLSGSGSVEGAGVSGAGAITTGGLAVSGSGTVTPPPTGSGAITTAGLSLGGTGTVSGVDQPIDPWFPGRGEQITWQPRQPAKKKGKKHRHPMRIPRALRPVELPPVEFPPPLIIPPVPEAPAPLGQPFSPFDLPQRPISPLHPQGEIAAPAPPEPTGAHWSQYADQPYTCRDELEDMEIILAAVVEALNE